MNYADLVNIIYSKTIENQGITVNIEGTEPHAGYTVATNGNEIRIKLDDFTPEKIEKYIKSKRVSTRYFLTTYILNDVVYMDIVYFTEFKVIAIEVGKVFGQICIWDIQYQQEIYWLSEELQLCLN
jgi:hypothetical protein